MPWSSDSLSLDELTSVVVHLFRLGIGKGSKGRPLDARKLARVWGLTRIYVDGTGMEPSLKSDPEDYGPFFRFVRRVLSTLEPWPEEDDDFKADAALKRYIERNRNCPSNIGGALRSVFDAARISQLALRDRNQ